MKDFRGYLREVRSLIGKGQEGSNMPRAGQAPLGPEPKGQETRPLEDWFDNLNELLATFKNARSQANKHRIDARHSAKMAETWDTNAADALKEVMELMRNRCGEDLVKALSTLEREIRNEQESVEDLEQWDEETLVTLPPDDLEINLNERFE